MHTVELLQEALDTARQLGFQVKQDWLGGDGGGHCLVRGRKWLLLDLAQPADEQLDVVAAALQTEVKTTDLDMSPELAQRLELLRAA